MNTNVHAGSVRIAQRREAGSTGILWAGMLALLKALAEGKAAADHYETLLARGAGPGEAARAVFLSHFA